MSVAAQLKELTGKVDELSKSAEAMKAAHALELAAVRADVIQRDETIATLTAERDGLNAENQNIMKALADANSELDKSKKALSLEPLAHVTDGRKPLVEAVDASGGGESGALAGSALLKKYGELMGAEKTLFYRANKAAIDAAIEKKNNA